MYGTHNKGCGCIDRATTLNSNPVALCLQPLLCGPVKRHHTLLLLISLALALSLSLPSLLSPSSPLPRPCSFFSHAVPAPVHFSLWFLSDSGARTRAHSLSGARSISRCTLSISFQFVLCSLLSTDCFSHIRPRSLILPPAPSTHNPNLRSPRPPTRAKARDVLISVLQ